MFLGENRSNGNSDKIDNLDNSFVKFNKVLKNNIKNFTDILSNL